MSFPVLTYGYSDGGSGVSDLFMGNFVCLFRSLATWNGCIPTSGKFHFVTTCVLVANFASIRCFLRLLI